MSKFNVGDVVGWRGLNAKGTVLSVDNKIVKIKWSDYMYNSTYPRNEPLLHVIRSITEPFEVGDRVKIVKDLNHRENSPWLGKVGTVTIVNNNTKNCSVRTDRCTDGWTGCFASFEELEHYVDPVVKPQTVQKSVVSALDRKEAYIKKLQTSNKQLQKDLDNRFVKLTDEIARKEEVIQDLFDDRALNQRTISDLNAKLKITMALTDQHANKIKLLEDRIANQSAMIAQYQKKLDNTVSTAEHDQLVEKWKQQATTIMNLLDTTKEQVFIIETQKNRIAKYVRLIDDLQDLLHAISIAATDASKLVG